MVENSKLEDVLPILATRSKNANFPLSGRVAGRDLQEAIYFPAALR